MDKNKTISFIIRPYRSTFSFEQDLDVVAFTTKIAQTMLAAIKKGYRCFALALYSEAEEAAVIDTFFDFKRAYPNLEFYLIYFPSLCNYSKDRLAFLKKHFKIAERLYKVKLTSFLNVLKTSNETVFVLERRRSPKYIEYTFLYAEVNHIPTQVIYADDYPLL